MGISDKEGYINIYGEGTGASMDKGNALIKDTSPVIVPVETLENICNRYCKKNHDIHFMKIDVEGWEKQCLVGMNFADYRPWIVCMEASRPDTGEPAYFEWENLLFDNGYVLAYDGKMNRYYCLGERNDLLLKLKEAD